MQKRILSGLIAGVVMLTGCQTEVTESEPVLRSVRTVVISGEDSARERTFSGTSASSQQTRQSFKVAGTIVELPIEVGDTLARGDLIARLDDSEYQLQAQQSQASLAQARAAERNAQANYDRVKGLYENSSVARNELDSARANAESAQAQVRAASKSLELANLSVGYTSLRAGFDCSVASVNVELNENVSAGTTIATTNCGSDLEVQVDVPESVISQIRAGMRVRVEFSALAGSPYQGFVKEVGVAATNGATFPVVIAVEGDQSNLRAGMAAQVTYEFSDAPQGRFLLPISAVVDGAEGKFVYLAEADGEEATLSRRSVELGELTEGGVEILAGLEVGDRVVTAGVNQVRPGMRVKL